MSNTNNPAPHASHLAKYLAAFLMLSALVVGPPRASAETSRFVDVRARSLLGTDYAARLPTLDDNLWSKPIEQPKPTVLASSGLVQRVTAVVVNGLQVTASSREGKLYVNVENRSLGGMLTLRYVR